MRNLLLTAITLLIIVPAAYGGDTEIYLRPTYFKWTEDIPARNSIKERGMLYAAGISHRQALSGPLYAGGLLELWGGRIDYDGYSVEGWVPYSTDTNYFGTREELTLGVAVPLSESTTFRPFVGIGHKYWLRSRSDESWNTLFGKFGARFEQRFGDRLAFIEAGALAPAYTRLHVDWSSSGFGDFVLEPKSVVSPFAAIGLEFGHFSFSVSYEEMNFGKSGQVAVSRTAGSTGAVLDNSLAHQPDSKSSALGIRMQYRF